MKGYKPRDYRARRIDHGDGSAEAEILNAN
jgi:hypothetical protein